MSTKQPFCDQNHKGTAFKPVIFVIQEPVTQLELCGCKFTTEPPFCDKVSCQKARDLYGNLDVVEEIHERQVEAELESQGNLIEGED